MIKHILQILHTYPDGGYNVIETVFDKVYQVDAEMRRHKKQAHPTAECEMFHLTEEVLGDQTHLAA